MTLKNQPEIKRPSLSSVSTYESLRDAERLEPGPAERPRELGLKQLCVAPKVFQWRDLQFTQTADDAQMRELVRVLLERGAPLDPLLVAPIGSKFFILDGHHRFDAYHTVGWKNPVPVEYFDGNLKEAQIEALRRNSKNKLPITSRDKFEAAWRLVCQGDATQKVIAEAATIGRRTVSTMAKVLKDHPQSQAMAWRKARRFQWGDAPDDLTDDWRARKAEKWARQWAKNLPTDFAAHADIVAMALQILNEEFPRQLVHYWTGKDVELLADMSGDFEL